MDEALPRIGLLGSVVPDVKFDLVLRQDFKDDELSESELEVIGAVLPELIGELMQMSQDRE